MSIATDVSRIKGNITAALAAIVDKGVTVPTGSNSDALASLIASIEAGGAGFATGTLTFNESQETTSNLTITHNLGFAPDHILWFIIETEAKSSDKFYANNYQVSFEYISQEAYLINSNPSHTETSNLNYFIATSGNYLNIINKAESNKETIKLFFPYAWRHSNNIPASSTIRWLVW